MGVTEFLFYQILAHRMEMGRDYRVSLEFGWVGLLMQWEFVKLKFGWVGNEEWG